MNDAHNIYHTPSPLPFYSEQDLTRVLLEYLNTLGYSSDHSYSEVKIADGRADVIVSVKTEGGILYPFICIEMKKNSSDAEGGIIQAQGYAASHKTQIPYFAVFYPIKLMGQRTAVGECFLSSCFVIRSFKLDEFSVSGGLYCGEKPMPFHSDAVKFFESRSRINEQCPTTIPANEQGCAIEIVRNIKGIKEVICQIGSGRHADVFLCMYKKIKNPVALKILRRDLLSHIEIIKRLSQEVDVLMQLTIVGKEENVVGIYEHDEIGRCPYYIMEYIPDSLNILEYVGKNTTEMNFLSGIRLFVELCGAIHRLHNGRPQVVHRDLKPSNVLVKVDGDKHIIKIADFGSSLFDDIRLSSDHSDGKGTFSFMAPELYNDKEECDKKLADVFSLGMILLSLFLNREATPYDKGKKDDFLSIASPKVSAPLEFFDVIAKATHEMPEKRYGSPLALANALEPLVEFVVQVHGESALIPSAELIGIVSASNKQPILWYDVNCDIYDSFSHAVGLISSLGKPIFAIDFHGDIADIVPVFFQKNRTNSYGLIEYSSDDFVPTYNAFKSINKSTRYHIISGIIRSFEKFLGKKFTKQQESMLRDIVIVISESTVSHSLYSITSFFEDQKFRTIALSQAATSRAPYEYRNLVKHFQPSGRMTRSAIQLGENMRDVFSSKLFEDIVSDPSAYFSPSIALNKDISSIIVFSNTNLSIKYCTLLGELFINDLLSSRKDIIDEAYIIVNGAEHIDEETLNNILQIVSGKVILRFTHHSAENLITDALLNRRGQIVTSENFALALADRVGINFQIKNGNCDEQYSEKIFFLSKDGVSLSNEALFRMYCSDSFSRIDRDKWRRLSLEKYCKKRDVVFSHVDKLDQRKDWDDLRSIKPAILELEKICRTNPEALNQISRICYAAGMKSHGDHVVKIIKKMSPSGMSPWTALTHSHDLDGDYSAALNACISGLRIFSTGDDWSEENTKRAMALFNKSVSMSLIDGAVNLPEEFFLVVKNLIDAVNAIGNSISLRNDHLHLLMFMAKMNWLVENRVDSSRFWSEALELDRRGRAWLERGRWAKDVENDLITARYFLQKGVERFPENGEIRVSISDVIISALADSHEPFRSLVEARIHLEAISFKFRDLPRMSKSIHDMKQRINGVAHSMRAHEKEVVHSMKRLFSRYPLEYIQDIFINTTGQRGEWGIFVVSNVLINKGGKKFGWIYSENGVSSYFDVAAIIKPFDSMDDFLPGKTVVARCVPGLHGRYTATCILLLENKVQYH